MGDHRLWTRVDLVPSLDEMGDMIKRNTHEFIRCQNSGKSFNSVFFGLYIICIHIQFDNSPMVTSNHVPSPDLDGTEHPYRHQSTNCQIFVRHLRHVSDQKRATSVLRKHSNMLFNLPLFFRCVRAVFVA